MATTPTKNIKNFPVATSFNAGDVAHISQNGVDKQIDSTTILEQISGGQPFRPNILTESGVSRTLTGADKSGYISCTNPLTTTITVSSEASSNWRMGEVITIHKEAAGDVVFQGDSGVTVNPSVSGLTLSEVGQVGTLLYKGNNIWDFLTGGSAATSIQGAITFDTVASLKAGATIEGGSIIDWSEYLGRKISTVVHNTTSNTGGAEYVIVNVNPSNLSTLTGGVWVGANHDLGGGHYAKLIPGDNGFNSLAFGCTGVDDTAALTAWFILANTERALHLDKFDYVTSGLTLNGGGNYTNAVITCSGAHITDDTSVTLAQIFDVEFSGTLVIEAPTIYIAGLRYCRFNKVDFEGLVKWGFWSGEVPVQGSYSIYWNNFETCKFALGQQVKSSVAKANFNSNQFTNCELRGGTLALVEFYNTVNNDPVFSSNTYVNCDMSYNAVFYLSDPLLTQFSAVNIIGGYLDTGTAVYASGSEKFGDLEVIGLRNPSGHLIDNRVTANLQMTSGGVRTKTNIPSGSKSFLLTEQIPNQIVGTGTRTVTSAPLPYDGHYSINSYMEVVGLALQTTVFENLTTGGVTNTPVTSDKRNSFTFSASKGDIVKLSLIGGVGTDVLIKELSLTGGAGVVDAIPYRTFNPMDIYRGSLVSGVPSDILTINVGTLRKGQMYEIGLYSQNQVAAGGGELVKYLLAVCSGGSSMSFTLSEVTRVSVNGVGGASDDSGTITLSGSASGVSLTLSATITGIAGTVYKLSISSVNSALL